MKEKFRTLDSKILADNYVVAQQFVDNIVTFAREADAMSPEDLPDSMVPTNVLLNLCLCYSIMYDKLIDHQLLSKLTSNKLIQ